MNEELTDAQLSALNQKIDRGSKIRGMCQTEGYKILKKRMDDKVTDLKNKWLTADEDEAKKLKIRGQIYMEIIDELKKLMLEGDVASKYLKEYQEI